MASRGMGYDFLGQRAQHMADGTQLDDGATYGQMLALKQGMDLKDPVRTVSVSNISLTGLQTIDGVTLAAGDRHLAAGQTTGSANGVYVVASGAWTRATDCDENAEVTPGFTVAVLEGTQKGTGANQANVIRWSLTNKTNPTIGTTALTFAPEGSAGVSYGSGSGAINVANGQISFVPKGSGGILQDGSGAYVDPAATTSRKQPYAADIPATSAGASVTMTHGLNSLDVIWQVFRKSDGVLIDVPDSGRDANSVTLVPPVAIAANAYRFLALPL